MDPVRIFRYRLAAALRKESWEGAILGIEVTRARKVFEEKQKRHDEVLGIIARTEADLRELYLEDQQIPLERRRILELFLRHQHAVAKLRQQEAAQAEAVYGQAMAQLQSKRRAIRAMENHRERRRREHNASEIRIAIKAQDDLWLLRRR
jgi:hypothetical protein